MTAKRRTLSESVIKQFVQNPDSVTASEEKLAEVNAEASQQVSTDSKDEKEVGYSDESVSSLASEVIAQFQIAEKEATVRFTVDLAQSKHKKFGVIAKQLNTNMSSLARTLIEKFIAEVEQHKLL